MRVPGCDVHGRPVLVLDSSRENSSDTEEMVAYLGWCMQVPPPHRCAPDAAAAAAATTTAISVAATLTTARVERKYTKSERDLLVSAVG